ncbi:hypothetical protein TNCV_4898541 [Trichonephila clavipes]|nr:hypothetical protein TNCV_4898541 [Trichonephila clavipes]
MNPAAPYFALMKEVERDENSLNASSLIRPEKGSGGSMLIWSMCSTCKKVRPWFSRGPHAARVFDTPTIGDNNVYTAPIMTNKDILKFFQV